MSLKTDRIQYKRVPKLTQRCTAWCACRRTARTRRGSPYTDVHQTHYGSQAHRHNATRQVGTGCLLYMSILCLREGERVHEKVQELEGEENFMFHHLTSTNQAGTIFPQSTSILSENGRGSKCVRKRARVGVSFGTIRFSLCEIIDTEKEKEIKDFKFHHHNTTPQAGNSSLTYTLMLYIPLQVTTVAVLLSLLLLLFVQLASSLPSRQSFSRSHTQFG